MVNSLESRIMAGVRKFKELGASENKELPEITPIEQIPTKTQLEENRKED